MNGQMKNRKLEQDIEAHERVEAAPHRSPALHSSIAKLSSYWRAASFVSIAETSPRIALSAAS
eukprot:m.246816 g.246816  ORF g.246816 m.246816 type:complete len:63 (+) comp26438_c0_seq2:581-769(+)